jgi:hypothetical protein
VIRYRPLSKRDIERMRNMNNIYNCTGVGVHAMNILRMRRTAFFHLVKTFRDRGLLLPPFPKIRHIIL